jgi:KipI family sensor histidine kinase inhibitor
MTSRIIAAGDSAWLVELPDRLDPDVNSRAIEIAWQVEQAALPGVTDVVVGYRTVMVYVDRLAPGADGVQAALERLVRERPARDASRGRLVDVPVCYGGPYGPDLADVAAFGRCTPDQVIARHLGAEYRVYLVGFVPGFAYMASVDPTIAAPRRSSPRVAVPAGALGIAGRQTGIYPASTPGGWNLIGRCPTRPYDPHRAEPFLLRAGDRVCFRRITEEEYRATSEWGDA